MNQSNLINLLTSPAFRVELNSGRRDVLTLPDVYEKLYRDEIQGFMGLRPHQWSAWHTFLAQLGVLALHECGRNVPWETKECWAEGLRSLTTDYPGDEPWTLVVADETKPAFLQTPDLHKLSDYKKKDGEPLEDRTPDDLDILITTKNHGVLQSVGRSAHCDHWAYALINIQTHASPYTAGYYNASRMNGGTSSRSFIGLAPKDGGFGKHIFHDIARMLDSREQVLEYPFYKEVQGLKLLWLKPWTGEKNDSIQLNELDPYFIEVARRVRLTRKGGKIIACKAPSKTTRLLKEQLEHQKGDLGDHWTVIQNADKKKSISFNKNHIRYDKLWKILSEQEYTLPHSMKVPQGDLAPYRLIFHGIEGGQSVTQGVHRRQDVIFSPWTARRLGRRAPDLVDTMKKQISEVSKIQDAVKVAVAIMMRGKEGIEKKDWVHIKAPLDSLMDRFHKAVDTIFFEYIDARLRTGSEEKKKEVRLAFGRDLIQIARETFQIALQESPKSRKNHYLIVAAAERKMNSLFNASPFKDQPEIFSS